MVRLALEIGLGRDSKEDVDLELRLGYSQCTIYSFHKFVYKLIFQWLSRFLHQICSPSKLHLDLMFRAVTEKDR